MNETIVFHQTKSKNIMYLSGIISLIGLILPSGFHYDTAGDSYLLELFWMCGLLFADLHISVQPTTDLIMFRDAEIVFPGWISLLLMVISSGLMISTARKITKSSISPKKAYSLTTVSIGLYFWAGMGYLVGMEIGWHSLTFNNFWGPIAIPFLGVYIAFLSGAIGIFALYQISKDKINIQKWTS